MAGARSIIGGLTALGLAGAAVIAGSPTSPSKLAPPTQPPASTLGLAAPAGATLDAASSSDNRVCLSSDMSFFAAARAGCMSKEQIAAMRNAPVLDHRGSSVSVQMMHPTDAARAPRAAATCADYATLAAEGWYAGSTREMRREAFFARACGALGFLADARAARTSHFNGGRLSGEDLVSLTAGPPFMLAEAARTGAAPTRVERVRESVWRLAGDGQSAFVQEIAHADFDGDDVGDVLVFVSFGPDEGSATVYEVGFVTKPSAAGPARFRQ